MAFFEKNDDLRRAYEALTIHRLWEAAWAEGAARTPPPQRGGLCKSPFRDDGSHGSFSILGSGGGTGFKDHGGAGHKGGLKQFAELCWPGLSARDLADKLISISGIVRTPIPPPGAAGRSQESGARSQENTAAAGADPEVAGKLARAADAMARRQRAAEAEERVYRAREERLCAPKITWAARWPACVEARWAEGAAHLAGDAERRAGLAAARGWPAEWMEALCDWGYVACPWERGCEPGAKWARRQAAFLVEEPRMVAGEVEMSPTGYHQRFFMPAKDGKPERKGWLYLPSVPKFAPRSGYERELVEAGKAAGVTAESEKTSLVNPAPFVLGDMANARVAVLLEGQWDAITFFGACGWFHDTSPPDGFAVFGIRGAQGIDAFLGLWARWLEARKPRVWLLADNDAAGGLWRAQPPAPPGLPRPPSLGERIMAVAGDANKERPPIVSTLNRGPHGKDFNDYWKSKGGARGVTVGAMWKWMEGLGLLA